jgi:3-dehydro-L-gulonate 2-dehydrogenase
MDIIRVPFDRMQQEFKRVLLKAGLGEEKALLCARLLAENSRDGVLSHGVNRFVGFVDMIKQGYVNSAVEAERVAALGAWEQWDGRMGVGPVNAYVCTERAMELAREYGLGCVALRNTNHWMRGGAYGWQAAEAGFIFICWTNTKPNMPPWGGLENRVGNNPLVLAVPRPGGAVVLDMAMSQFSYGRLETARQRGETLPVPGGFDRGGRLTQDPAAILETQQPLPIGYWKGAGLALLLDLIAALLAGGRTTYQIGQDNVEHGVCQVFIAFDASKPQNAALSQQVIEETIRDLHTVTSRAGENILYPGERALQTRREYLTQGIPVSTAIWQEILAL